MYRPIYFTRLTGFVQDQLSAVLTAYLIVKNIRETHTSRFLPNLITVNLFQREILAKKEEYVSLHFLYYLWVSLFWGVQILGRG